jgi:hypothetical protein
MARSRSLINSFYRTLRTQSKRSKNWRLSKPNLLDIQMTTPARSPRRILWTTC